MDPQTQQLDPSAVNLAKAIRQVESGGNFQARGKSGEFGAYQYTQGTWNQDAQKYLGNAIPLEQATPEQQNEVAYKKIKALKDSGYNVGQIASIWNSGSPDKYLQDFRGTNEKGVHYDVPAYAKSVATAYQKIKGGGVVYADPNTPSSIANKQNIVEPSSGDAPQGGYSVGGFVNNVAKSGVGILGGLANAVMHPIDTAKNIGGLALGAAEKLIPGTQGDEYKADAVGKYFKDRYGSLDRIKNSFYNDPVGVALDLSTVLTGGGAIASKIGELSDISSIAKAGELASAAGRVVDPLNAITKGVGLARKTAGSAAGITSGLGGEVNDIYEASKAGAAPAIGNQPWKPLSGFGKSLGPFEGMSAVMNPGTIPGMLPVLAASSPRIVAATAKALGITANKLEAVLKILEKTGLSRQAALRAITQAGRVSSLH